MKLKDKDKKKEVKLISKRFLILHLIYQCGYRVWSFDNGTANVYDVGVITEF
jgi:hypothetical protein